MNRYVTIVLSAFSSIDCSKENKERTMGKIVMNVVAKTLNLSVIPLPHMSVIIDNDHQLYQFGFRPCYALSYGISTYAIAPQHFVMIEVSLNVSTHHTGMIVYTHVFVVREIYNPICDRLCINRPFNAKHRNSVFYIILLSNSC